MSHYGLVVLGLLIGLFGGILICLELGYLIGRNDSKKIRELAYVGLGNIEAALFALLGLLLGFSFAGATSRLESRHQLIVREANAISTAYLRLDLLPASEQPAIRHLFRDYLNARLRAYEKFAHEEASEIEFARASALQGQIWSQALTASRADPTQDSARLLLPALTEMIDVATSRAIAQKIHLPALLFYLLIGIALLSGLLAGYSLSKRQTRSWLHVFIYAAIISITVYVIFDFDNPRFGLIKVDAADTALLQLRDSIR
ncbi:MAG TPA: hypothetical protein VIX91_12925 [Candidatus Acidoferrum sp.]